MEQGASNTVNTPVTNASTSQASSPVEANPPAKDDAVFTNKPKKNKGMILGMVLLGLLAVGGIGFGIWEMMDGNSQKEQLNSQIDSLKSQISELQEKTDENNETEEIEEKVLQNPIITASDPKIYGVQYSIPVSDGKTDANSMVFHVKEGKLDQCSISNVQDWECTINGLPDGIYKMGTIFEGNGIGSEKIGFVMEDGSVWYASIYDETNLGAAEIKRDLTAKKMNIDGFVKDIIKITYNSDKNNPVGGVISTVFVLSDGSLVKYDESMF